jgi:hypothetical protein
MLYVSFGRIIIHMVHPKQLIVIGTVRHLIDTFIPQILKIIPKMSESSLSRSVLEQILCCHRTDVAIEDHDLLMEAPQFYTYIDNKI